MAKILLRHRLAMRSIRLVAGMACCGAAWAAGNGQVYRCPGPPVLYTDTISAKEALDKGCRTIEGTPITIIQGGKPKTASPANTASASKGGGEGAKVDPVEQRNRDSDAKRILDSELRREEDALAMLKKEFNNGEPERRGDERNYQRYLDRVNEMKEAIARKELDVASIKRELGKLPKS